MPFNRINYLIALLALLISQAFIIPASSFAQQDYISYYRQTSSARKYSEKNNYDSAYILYKDAFSKVGYVRRSDLGTAITVAKKTGNKSQASSWKQLAKEERHAINKKYKAQILAISKADQKVRNNKHVNASIAYYACMKDSTCDKNSSEFLKAKALTDEWSRTDSINICKLLGLINIYGFPSEQRVGLNAETSAFAILLHYDKDTANTILPMLDSALYSGGILPANYAWLIDRRLNWDCGKAPYYYQITDGLDSLSKDQVTEVNKRRAAIGLSDVFDGLIPYYDHGKRQWRRVL